MMTKLLLLFMSVVPFVGFADEPAFLGVLTRSMPIEKANSDQDLGLIVEHVVPGSAAELELEPGDILKKMEDQVLISPEQLAGLVRIHKPGDMVSMIVRRGSKERSVRLSLGKRPQEIVQQAPLPVQPRLQPQPRMMPNAGMGFPMDLTERLREMEDQMARMQQQMLQIPQGFSSNATGTVMRHMQWQEDDTSLQYTEENGQASLTIQEEGREVFSGPVNTDKEWQKVPKKYRKMLEARGVGPVEEGVRL
jgi:hypothetical protein